MIFSRCQFGVEFGTRFSFKEKLKLKKLITQNGGTVSYIVNKKCTHIVVTDKEKAANSYKCRHALKLGIPVVSAQFVYDSVSKEALQNSEKYIMAGKTKAQELSRGKIVASRKDGNKSKRRPYVNVNGMKIWHPEDAHLPEYDEENFQIAKFSVFHRPKNHSEKTSYFTLEIHTSPTSITNSKTVGNASITKETETDDEIYVTPVMDLNHNFKTDQVTSDDSPAKYEFRVFSHYYEGKSDKSYNKNLNQEIRFCNTGEEALAIYSSLYHKITSHPWNFTKTLSKAPKYMGSCKLHAVQCECSNDDADLTPGLRALLDVIWHEAQGAMEDVLASPLSSIKPTAIREAESVLLEVRQALDEGTSAEKLASLSDQFYKHLPHTQQHQQPITTKRILAQKQDMCQLVKDMVTVTEATDWSMRSDVQAKYRALGCCVTQLKNDEHDFKYLMRLLQESKHGGLLLPKVVVDDFGGQRTDAGMLGSAIYFADSVITSAQYSRASSVSGTRFMLMCEVALGSSVDYVNHQTHLTSPPEGFHSTHGVKATDKQASQFHRDEYAVYDPRQQRMQYLIEFCLPGDHAHTHTAMETMDAEMEDNNEAEQDMDSQDIDLLDVQNLLDPLSKVQAGLISNSDAPVPLKSVHVKGKLLDMAANVYVLQEYKNDTNQAIEAKYVFPLDDMAVVCGFEAFINGKHIVGEVKEKETAHKEYKKAISEGHGAYLMDQHEESPDVFTVSVGNLPPQSTVLIKITYVAELQVEGERIIFRVPGSVAPWTQDSALEDTTQTDLDTLKVKESFENVTIQIAIEMPFDIREIECPSHLVRVKRTATKAVVQLEKNQHMGDGFVLHVTLAEIHVPRMWVERHPEHDTEACMLTFYPEFEAESTFEEVIFVLDLSNSMKGDPLKDAKKVLMLFLNRLSEGALFNLMVFGSTFDEVFPSTKPKNKTAIREAHAFIKKCSANMGNSNINRVMACLNMLRKQGRTNVMLISDGHLAEEEEVYREAKANAQSTRIFTCAVSSTANKQNLRSIARLGGGTYEYFDRQVKSKWERKVCSQLEKAAQPGLADVSVEWQVYDHDAPPPLQAPSQITSIFSGSRQVVYGFVPNCRMASLKARINGQEVSTVVSTPELCVTTATVLHELTARAIIRDWEEGSLSADLHEHEIIKRNRKSEIINLSIKHCIVTQFTSFIAVEKREKDEEVKDTGPSVAELVASVDVDILSELGWTQQTDLQANTEENVENILKLADRQEMYSVNSAENTYLQALRSSFENRNYKANRKVVQKFIEFYQRIGETEKAQNLESGKEFVIHRKCRASSSESSVDSFIKDSGSSGSSDSSSSDNSESSDSSSEDSDSAEGLDASRSESSDSLSAKPPSVRSPSPIQDLLLGLDDEDIRYAYKQNSSLILQSDRSLISNLSPAYSPTSPAYSPTSPSYTPTSPSSQARPLSKKKSCLAYSATGRKSLATKSGRVISDENIQEAAMDESSDDDEDIALTTSTAPFSKAKPLHHRQSYTATKGKLSTKSVPGVADDDTSSEDEEEEEVRVAGRGKQIATKSARRVADNTTLEEESKSAEECFVHRTEEEVVKYHAARGVPNEEMCEESEGDWVIGEEEWFKPKCANPVTVKLTRRKEEEPQKITTTRRVNKHGDEVITCMPEMPALMPPEINITEAQIKELEKEFLDVPYSSQFAPLPLDTEVHDLMATEESLPPTKPLSGKAGSSVTEQSGFTDRFYTQSLEISDAISRPTNVDEEDISDLLEELQEINETENTSRDIVQEKMAVLNEHRRAKAKKVKEKARQALGSIEQDVAKPVIRDGVPIQARAQARKSAPQVQFQSSGQTIPDSWHRELDIPRAGQRGRGGRRGGGAVRGGRHEPRERDRDRDVPFDQPRVLSRREKSRDRDRSSKQPSSPKRQEKSRDMSSPTRRRERSRDRDRDSYQRSPPRRRERSRDQPNSPRRRERSRDRLSPSPRRRERSRDGDRESHRRSPPRRHEKSRDQPSPSSRRRRRSRDRQRESYQRSDPMEGERSREKFERPLLKNRRPRSDREDEFIARLRDKNLQQQQQQQQQQQTSSCERRWDIHVLTAAQVPAQSPGQQQQQQTSSCESRWDIPSLTTAQLPVQSPGGLAQGFAPMGGGGPTFGSSQQANQRLGSSGFAAENQTAPSSQPLFGSRPVGDSAPSVPGMAMGGGSGFGTQQQQIDSNMIDTPFGAAPQGFSGSQGLFGSRPTPMQAPQSTTAALSFGVGSAQQPQSVGSGFSQTQQTFQGFGSSAVVRPTQPESTSAAPGFGFGSAQQQQQIGSCFGQTQQTFQGFGSSAGERTAQPESTSSAPGFGFGSAQQAQSAGSGFGQTQRTFQRFGSSADERTTQPESTSAAPGFGFGPAQQQQVGSCFGQTQQTFQGFVSSAPVGPIPPVSISAASGSGFVNLQQLRATVRPSASQSTSVPPSFTFAPPQQLQIRQRSSGFGNARQDFLRSRGLLGVPARPRSAGFGFGNQQPPSEARVGFGLGVATSQGMNQATGQPTSTGLSLQAPSQFDASYQSSDQRHSGSLFGSRTSNFMSAQNASSTGTGFGTGLQSAPSQTPAGFVQQADPQQNLSRPTVSWRRCADPAPKTIVASELRREAAQRTLQSGQAPTARELFHSWTREGAHDQEDTLLSENRPDSAELYYVDPYQGQLIHEEKGSDKPQETGLSFGKPNFRDEQNIQRLFGLQSPDGYWEFKDDECMSLLKISWSECCELLLNAGLKSLGTRMAEEVFRLVGTLFVLARLAQAMHGDAFLDNDWLQEHQSVAHVPGAEQLPGASYVLGEAASFQQRIVARILTSDAYMESVRRAVHWCTALMKRAPLVPCTLGLGRDWQHVIKHWLAPVSHE